MNKDDELPYSISMEGSEINFDSYLGGEQRLPYSLNVQEFCKHRIDEILMLTESLKESPFRGQVFQRLPRHMRRRQMSHYIKRLPRRLRASSLLSKKDETPSAPKCPSRNYRRRPQNLLLEYNRRQRKNIWLETHIWHAKRYHMTSKWGYRLPEKPSDKSFRACYRAASQHCFLHDMSYYNCIELKGIEETLLEGLQKCVSSASGLTFAAKMFRNGLREGSVQLYHPNSFPHGAIGEVSFLWKPTEDCESERTIWIFCHPAMHDEIVILFRELFLLSEVNEDREVVDDVCIEVDACDEVKECNVKKRKKILNKDDVKLAMKNLPFRKVPKFSNEMKTIRMNLLKDTINRFRLTGPLSLAVISSAFVVTLPLDASAPNDKGEHEVKEVAVDNITLTMKRSLPESEVSLKTKRVKTDEEMTNANHVDGKGEGKANWWQMYYIDQFKRECLLRQQKFYHELKDMGTPSNIPPATVFSVVIKDPRLTIPSKRTKSTVQTGDLHVIAVESLEPGLCHSPIWDSDVRDEVSRVKMSTNDINKIRSKLIVPGSDISCVLEDSKQARVPLLIVQRSDAFDTSECGTGFDIITPAGWGMPVWLSLVYRGARTGGLREIQSLWLETNSLSGYFQPDSAAGVANATERWAELRKTYFKLPPSKRPNFIKNKIRSPFFFPWRVLLKDWTRRDGASTEDADDTSQFFVLRDKKKLLELDDLLKNLRRAAKRGKSATLGHTFSDEDLDCLVPVSIRSCNRGVPKEFSMLCMPTVEDVRLFSEKGTCPEELPGIDMNEQIRKLARVEQTKLLKSLRRKRKKDKLKEAQTGAGKDDVPKDGKQKKHSSEVAVSKYKSKMEELWLPDPGKVDSVIESCSRTIMGYVVLGGFSFAKAAGCGLGYVSMRALLSFLKNCYLEKVHPSVLFRNSSSSTYRFAKLEICLT